MGKYEWIRNSEGRGHVPTQAEVDNWISALTPYRLDGMRSRAAELFDIAARGYLAEAHKKDTEDAIGRSIVSEVKAIVSEVRAASGFGKQLTVALVTAILAPIIIGGIIAGALTWDKFFPTPTEAANTIQSHPPPNPLLPEAPHPPSARNGP